MKDDISCHYRTDDLEHLSHEELRRRYQIVVASYQGFPREIEKLEKTRRLTSEHFCNAESMKTFIKGAVGHRRGSRDILIYDEAAEVQAQMFYQAVGNRSLPSQVELRPAAVLDRLKAMDDLPGESLKR